MSFDKNGSPEDENGEQNGREDGAGSNGDGGSDDALGAVETRAGEPDPVSKVRSDEKARAMLKVLDEARGSEGGARVGTSEFRERTGMASRGVHYRYDKLKDAGFIEVEYDAGATPEGVAPMKVAVLTERGEQAIVEGLAGDTTDVTEDTVEDRVDAIGGEVRENREALRDIYQWIQSTDERLDALEERIEEVVSMMEEQHDAQPSTQGDDVGGSDVGEGPSSITNNGDREKSEEGNGTSEEEEDDGFMWES